MLQVPSWWLDRFVFCEHITLVWLHSRLILMMPEVVTFTAPTLAMSCNVLHLSHANILKDQVSFAPAKCPAEGEVSYTIALSPVSSVCWARCHLLFLHLKCALHPGLCTELAHPSLYLVGPESCHWVSLSGQTDRDWPHICQETDSKPKSKSIWSKADIKVPKQVLRVQKDFKRIFDCPWWFHALKHLNKSSV